MTSMKRGWSLAAAVLAVLILIGFGTGAFQRIAEDLAFKTARRFHLKAKWTVLVYMNADNQVVKTLEPAALCDFDAMARVGSSRDVSLVVEFERSGDLGGNVKCTEDKTIQVSRWKGMARFFMNRNIKPEPEQALGPLDTQTDMADVDAFRRFLTWGLKEFPAERYVLVFFNHGDGVSIGAKAGTPDYLNLLRNWLSLPSSPKIHLLDDEPLTLVTQDGRQDGRKLYITDVEKTLSEVLPSAGIEKIEIVGFDSCFMGMVENAYALHNVADFMVASEEPLPPAGWDYFAWLSRLVSNPHLDSKELAWDIVNAFNNAHRNDQIYPLTESVIDLSQIGPLATAIDNFAAQYKIHRHELTDNYVQNARGKCPPSPAGLGCDYGSGISAIDLGFFIDHLLELEQQQLAERRKYPLALEQSRSSLNSALDAAVPANYSSEDSRMQRGSTGLAIYFPRLRGDYLNEQARGLAGYGPNSVHRSSFDKEHAWSAFLDAVWNVSSSRAISHK